MIKVPLTDLIFPSWGWHLEDPEQDHKLRTSIQQHGQLAALVVREVKIQTPLEGAPEGSYSEQDRYEIIDGRRRYALLKDLGITDVWILNKGVLSDAEAVRVALTLELTPTIDYAGLAQHVKKLGDPSLASTTPFSAERLAYLIRLCGFDWAQYEVAVQDGFWDDEDTPEPVAAPIAVAPTPIAPKIPAQIGLGREIAASARLSNVLDFAPPVAAPVSFSPPSTVDGWDSDPTPAIPMAPLGGVQFFGVERPVSNWTPQEPPCLDGVKDITLNFETMGLRWYAGDKPLGVTVGTLDGQLKRFLPFGFTGGNLDEDTVKRWAQRELRGKHITNAHTGFEVHMSRVWGIDLEEQDCTFSDVMHYAALLDEYRREFALDVLVKDFLEETGPPRVDESRMATYHAGDVALRAEYQVEAVAKLRAKMWPLLDKEDLQRVRQLEDDVIPVVCEMEKNAAHVDRGLLQQWVQRSAEDLNACLWDVAKDLGFDMNPDKNEDWQKLFAHYQIPVTAHTEKGAPSFTDDVLKHIEHPKVQLARRAGKLASLRSKFLLAYNEVVGEDCKLRFALHQLRGDEYGTVRGRFSMSGGGRNQPRFGANPQQVMRVNSQREAFGFKYDDDSHDAEIYLVRALFIPEPYVRDDGSDTEYLAADAQSIEYRLGAHFAQNDRVPGSDKLIKAYQKDAIQLQEGRLTDKWVDFHAVTGDIIRPYKDLSRNIVKNANFCLVYGGGEETATKTMGVTPTEGSEIVRVWRRMFPEFKELHKRASGLAETRGYVKTILGRRARFPDKTWCHAALNYVIQGSAADVMKVKLVELHKARKETGLLMRQTVHDEVDGDARLPDTAARVRAILNRQSFPAIKVPIVWEVSTGKNWAVAK